MMTDPQGSIVMVRNHNHNEKFAKEPPNRGAATDDPSAQTIHDAGLTLDDVMAGSVQGLAVLGRNHILYASDRFASFFATTGDALAGRHIGSLISAESLDRLRRTSRKKTVQELELDGAGLRLKAMVRRVTWAGKPAVQITAVDEPARPQTKAEVKSRQIIHDFNNCLAVILGNLELASAAIDDDSRTARRLGAASNAARQAAKLAQRLLKVSPSEDH